MTELNEKQMTSIEAGATCLEAAAFAVLSGNYANLIACVPTVS